MKKWWQFRLATLLLLVGAIAAWLGYYFSPAKRAERAVRSLHESGAKISFDYQRVPGEQWRYSARAEPPGSPALRRVVGEGLFQDADWIRLQDTPLTPDQLSPLKELASVRGISLRNCKIGDDHLRHFAGLSRLEMLTLQDQEITDAGLAHLEGLGKLENVSLTKNRIRGDGLRHLVNLKGLTKLFLQDNPISDGGLVYLGKMDSLEMLGLAGTEITDDGVKHLRRLKTLKYLGLTRTGVTKAAKADLRAALPDCEIE
jgi:hypothetical protein